MVILRATKKKVKEEIEEKLWTVPQVMAGSGVQVGGLERPGMYHLVNILLFCRSTTEPAEEQNNDK